MMVKKHHMFGLIKENMQKQLNFYQKSIDIQQETRSLHHSYRLYICLERFLHEKNNNEKKLTFGSCYL
jgi:hypothetical protein